MSAPAAAIDSSLSASATEAHLDLDFEREATWGETALTVAATAVAVVVVAMIAVLMALA